MSVIHQLKTSEQGGMLLTAACGYVQRGHGKKTLAELAELSPSAPLTSRGFTVWHKQTTCVECITGLKFN